MKLLKILLFFIFLIIFYLPIVNAVPNPAAVYCEDLGYEYRIIKTSRGEYGICIFLPGKACRGWTFYSGECGQEYSYCARQGYDIKTKTDGKNPYSPSYSVCVYKKGRNRGKEVGSVSDLLNFNTRFKEYEFRIEEESALLEEAGTLITEQADGLPSYFDWRDATLDIDGHGVPGNENGFNWTTPVGDQGSCGSCAHFPAIGAVEADANIEYNDPDLDLDLSEQDILSCSAAGSCQSTGSSAIALKYIRNTGVVDEPCFPYTAVDAEGCKWTCCNETCDPPVTPTLCSDKCPDWESRVFKIYSYGAVPDTPADIKNILINEGPIIIYMYWGTGNWDLETGVWSCSSTGDINHAVVLVGYDDTLGYWILKNQWGTGWPPDPPLGPGGDGYFNLSYGSCNLDAIAYVSTTSGAYDCFGHVQLSLSPSLVYATKSVIATTSGLSYCDGKAVSIKQDSCTGTTVCSCTASGGGCSCNFKAPSSADDYTYYTCVDKDGDGTYEIGDYNSKTLVVMPCRTSGQTCNADTPCCSGLSCSFGTCGGGRNGGGGGGCCPMFEVVGLGLLDVLKQPAAIITVLIIIVIIFGVLTLVAKKK